MIDLSEFLDLTAAMQLNITQQQAVKLFADVDPDSSGALDVTEFTAAMGR